MREIRHCSSRFAVHGCVDGEKGGARAKARCVRAGQGGPVRSVQYIYSLSPILYRYPDQFIYLNEGFKTSTSSHSLHRVPPLAFPNNKFAPLPARNRSQEFRSPYPSGVNRNGRSTRVFFVGCCSNIRRPGPLLGLVGLDLLLLSRTGYRLNFSNLGRLVGDVAP